jgi:hypothetical protein
MDLSEFRPHHRIPAAPLKTITLQVLQSFSGPPDLTLGPFNLRDPVTAVTYQEVRSSPPPTPRRRTTPAATLLVCPDLRDSRSSLTAVRRSSKGTLSSLRTAIWSCNRVLQASAFSSTSLVTLAWGCQEAENPDRAGVRGGGRHPDAPRMGARAGQEVDPLAQNAPPFVPTVVRSL